MSRFEVLRLRGLHERMTVKRQNSDDVAWYASSSWTTKDKQIVAIGERVIVNLNRIIEKRDDLTHFYSKSA